MTERPAVAALRACKGGRQIIEMHVDGAEEDAAACEAGIEMFTGEADAKLPCIRAAAPGVFIQSGHDQGVVPDEASAIREGFNAIETGADATQSGGSLRIFEAMAR